MSIEIERIAAPSPEDFEREYVMRSRPVIITGIVDRWRASSTWSLAYLRERIGHRRVPTTVLRDGVKVDKREMLVAEVLDHTEHPRGPERYYIADIYMSRVPELLADVEDAPYFGDFIRESFQRFRVVFIGHQSTTSLHHHVSNQALSCQVVGKKRFLLYHPSQTRYLYPGLKNFSDIDPLNPDLKKFPKFERARPLDLTLNAGEMLFIPTQWWHWVQSDEFGITVLYNYPSPLRTWHFPRPGLESLFMHAYLKWRYPYIHGPGKYFH